jgi:methylmalonyl-CoA/ethylmalonyl-CoA epimerase
MSAPTPSIAPDTIDLDHVAVAAESHADVWPRYAGELAGDWVSGGVAIGFAAGQVRYANGMKLEVLAPANVDQNDFLRRFLDRNGPGPHHLTYKVKDIRGALKLAEAAGYRPVNAQLDDPGWKEAFLHPKDAPGVVVQLAQAAGDWSSDPPADLPAPVAGAARATLLHVAHAVASLDEGLRLFEGLLSGQRVAEGEGDGVRWVELGWKGPGRVRLIQPTSATGSGAEVSAWLQGRPGRVLELVFQTDSPHVVTGAQPVADGLVVPPENNLGTRIRLVP